MESSPVYESPALREITGPTMRPGGFHLTRRGIEYSGLKSGSAVLDIGCGVGATVNWLKDNYGIMAVGLDSSILLLKEGRSACTTSRMAAGLAHQLPFADDSFDGILCECVLSLLNDPLPALVEFKRVLRPGARLIISDLYAGPPKNSSTFKRLASPSCLKGAKPKVETLDLMEKAGFQADLWEDHSILLTQMAAKYVFERGSISEFWSIFSPDCAGSDLRHTFEKSKPGYFLLTAFNRS